MSRKHDSIIEWSLFIIAVFVFGSCLLPTRANASDDYDYALGMVCCSSHAREKDKDLNTDNRGVFLRINTSDKALFIAGTFKNSFSRQATFIGYGPRWEVLKNIEVSFPLGVTTGYQETPSPFMIPTITINEVFNLHIVPTVVYGISFNIVRW